METQRQQNEDFLSRQLAFARKEEIRQLAAIEMQLIQEEGSTPKVPKFEIPSFKQGRPSKPLIKPPSFKITSFKVAQSVVLQEPSPLQPPLQHPLSVQSPFPNTISLFKGGPIVQKAVWFDHQGGGEILSASGELPYPQQDQGLDLLQKKFEDYLQQGIERGCKDIEEPVSSAHDVDHSKHISSYDENSDEENIFDVLPTFVPFLEDRMEIDAPLCSKDVVVAAHVKEATKNDVIVTGGMGKGSCHEPEIIAIGYQEEE